MKRCDVCKKESARHIKGLEFSLERKGCKKKIPNPVFKVPSISGFPDLIFYRCPTNFVNFKCRDLINQNAQFNNGIMPYSGGLDEQPAKFVETMLIVDNMIEQHREDQKKTLEKINGKRSTSRNHNR